MKLIDLMIKEGVEWPEGATFAMQDSDGEIKFTNLGRPNRLELVWRREGNGLSYNSLYLGVVVDNWREALVTRDEYQAALAATKPQGHPHAAIMAEYAEVAKTNPKPWEEFERNSSSGWVKLESNEQFVASREYRRKPRTININGYEVPEPLRVAPDKLSMVWVVDFFHGPNAMPFNWHGASKDYQLLSFGVIHTTKEAAELHAKALLSFTKK